MIFFHNLIHPPDSRIMWWPVMAIGSSEPVKEWEAFKAHQQNAMGTWANRHGRAWVESNTNVGWNTEKLIFLDRLDLCQSWVCKILLTGHHLCHPCSSMEPRWRRLAEASSDTATDMSLCCNQRATWCPATKAYKSDVPECLSWGVMTFLAKPHRNKATTVSKHLRSHNTNTASSVFTSSEQKSQKTWPKHLLAWTKNSAGFKRSCAWPQSTLQWREDPS